MIRHLIPVVLLLLTCCGSGTLEKALIKAAGLGDTDQVSHLLAQGADVNGIALDGWTPLTRAAAAGQLDVVKLLLARRADINRTGTTVTALHWAVFHGHLGISEYLVMNGGQLNLEPNLKASLLERVHSYENHELTKLVIEMLAREGS